MPECRRHAVFQFNIIYSARKGQDDFVKMYSRGEFCAAVAPFLWKLPSFRFFEKKLGKKLYWVPYTLAALYRVTEGCRLCRAHVTSGLRPGTMQSFLIAWFSLLRKRLSFCTLAAVRLTREWSFSRFRKLPVCAPARRKVCSDSWIRINSKSKHTNKTPPPAEKSGKFHFQAWFWPFGMVVCIFAVISGGIQIPMDTKSSLCRASHRTRAQPGRNVSAAQSATLCHPIKSGQSAWYPGTPFLKKRNQVAKRLCIVPGHSPERSKRAGA